MVLVPADPSGTIRICLSSYLHIGGLNDLHAYNAARDKVVRGLNLLAQSL